MGYEAIIVITVVALGMLLGVWGASLVVRAMASRASHVAARFTRRVSTRIRTKRSNATRVNAASPQLSKLQFRFGVIVGPIACVFGAALIAYILGLITLDGEMKIPWGAIPAFFVAVLAFAVLVVGIRWDKPRGRRRCPTCWYDYAGLGDAAPCPECGGVPTSARALIRTRRSRTLIRLAPVLVILAWVAYVTPTVLRVGWRGAIPTTVLIAGFEHLPRSVILSPTGAEDGTLASRFVNDGLSKRELAWLCKRALHVLQTNDDPRTCKAAVFFGACSLYTWPDGDRRRDAVDRANANMIRVAMRSYGDAARDVCAHSLIEELFPSMGPQAQKAMTECLGQMLARYAAATTQGEQIALASLLASFAPSTPDVVDAARTVAFGPPLTSDAHDAACIALGMIAARDDIARGQLVADFENASGTTRDSIATALAGSLVDPELASLPNAWSGLTLAGYRFTDRLLAIMESDDPAIRNGAIAAVRGTPLITRASLDWDALKQPLLDIAATKPESRKQAIATLIWIHGITADAVPTLVEMTGRGDAEDLALVVQACKRAPIDANWQPVLAALRERLEDATLETASRDALTGAEAHIEGVIAP